MDRLIATNSVPAASADTAPAAGTPQFATNGNPVTAVPATQLPAYQYNAIQEELIAIIAAASIAPDRNNNAQVLAAIRALIAASTVSPSVSMLQLSGSSAGGGVTAAWTAKELTAETALAGTAYRGANLALNFNGAVVGAGGMDTGAMPVSGDLSIYAIYDPVATTWNTLGCAGATSNGPIYSGANMPAGYTASLLIASLRTDSSGHILGFFHVDRHIWARGLVGGSGLSANVWTSLTLGIPANARTVSGFVTKWEGTNNFYLAGDANGTGEQVGAATIAGTDSVVGSFVDVPIITPQTVYYMNQPSTGNATVSITGYSI